jgi:hypothetical protein
MQNKTEQTIGSETVSEDPEKLYSEMMDGGEVEEVEEVEEADEADGVDPVDEEAEETDETEETEDAEPEDVDELKDEKLPEHTKAKLNKRFAKLTKEVTELSAKAATAEERAAAAESEAVALRTQLNAVSRKDVLKAAGIDPLLAAQDAGELVEAEGYWKRVKRFTERYKGEPDGFEGEVDGKTVTYSREQLQNRYEQALDMLEETIPQAREVFSHRENAKAEAAKVYPELLKSGTQENLVFQNALRTVAGLNVMPNAAILVGDMLLGEKLRDAKVNEITVAGRTFVLKGSPATAPARKVPKVPVKPTPAGRSPVAAKKKGSGMFDHKAVEEADDPEKAALEQYANLM